jgi:diguanylate cyclase (GGDEF)-like protein
MSPLAAWIALGAIAGGVLGWATGGPATGGLAAGAGGLVAYALLPRRRSGHDSGATRTVDLDLRFASLRQELGRLEDERELQRGVFEVSSELVGCVDAADARTRFTAALRRYWSCTGADLLIWERGTWKGLGGAISGPLPVLDQPVQLPTGDDAEGHLVLDLSPGVAGRAAIVLHRARPQPSLAGRGRTEQLAVAETLRTQLTLSLRRVILYGELQALSRTDLLTSTHRRWYGESRLRELVDGGDVVAVAMVDIDRFKSINDSWGHAVGDQVLEAVGRALGGGLRSNDLVCRWGGEEFLVILPDTPPAGSLHVAERLRRAITDLTGLPQPVTVSIGLAGCAQDDTHFDLVARADEALYAAKRDGRNRVVVAEPETSGTHLLRKTSRRARAREAGSPALAAGPVPPGA